MRSLVSISLACLLVLLTSHCINAQTITWQRTYGDGNIDYAYSIVQTPDQGFIVAGRKRVNTDSYISAIRLDKFGDTLWTKYFTGFKANQIEMLKDGNYLITGVGNLIKIDINGNVIWSTPENAASKFRETEEGGIIQCLSQSNGPFLFFPKLRKLDSLGNTLWEKIFTKAIYSGRFSDICLDSEGNYLMTGNYSDSSFMKDRLFVMKTDSSGNQIWFREFSESMNSNSIMFVNNMIVVGGEFDPRAFVMALDTNGISRWLNYYDNGSPKFGTCQSIVATADSGIAFTGTYHNGNWEYYVRIVKTNLDGKEIWRMLYGFGDADFGLNIRQTQDKGFVVAAIRDNYNLGDVYVIKTDSIGIASPPISVGEDSEYTRTLNPEISNFPNPFNSITTFQITIQETSTVSIVVADMRGRIIRRLDNILMRSGIHKLSMNAIGLASGLYFCSLIVNMKHIVTRRMILIK